MIPFSHLLFLMRSTVQLFLNDFNSCSVSGERPDILTPSCRYLTVSVDLFDVMNHAVQRPLLPYPFLTL